METPDKKEELKTAAVVATELVSKAAHVAESLTKSTDERVTQSLVDALHEVFGEHKKTGRFVDVGRIPLICSNINEIHGDIREIKDSLKEAKDYYVNKDQFDPVKRVIYGLVGLILVAVVGAVLTLVIK